MSFVIAVFIFAVTAACGVVKSDYVPYEPKKGIDTDSECAVGLAGFAANISASIASSCGSSGCHKTGGGSVTLVDGSDASNRSNLLAYTGSTGDKLIAKLKSTSHSGGAAAKAALSEEEITAWMTEEAKCP